MSPCLVLRIAVLFALVVSLSGLLAPRAELDRIKHHLLQNDVFKKHVEAARPIFCKDVSDTKACTSDASEAVFCLYFEKNIDVFQSVSGAEDAKIKCRAMNKHAASLDHLFTLITAKDGQGAWSVSFLQNAASASAPEDDLAKEMTHDLEMNFNKIAPFGKEDTAKELQDHAAKTQDTLVDAVENAEVAEIKRAVFRALTRLRAATIKEFDTIARLETQAIDAYNDAHHYRAENPLTHLHEDEAPVETDKLKSFH